MVKRKRESNEAGSSFRVKTDHELASVLTKRKINEEFDRRQKRRIYDSEQENKRLLEENAQLKEMCHAFVRKIETLEYMLRMFQQNETLQSNRFITAY